MSEYIDSVKYNLKLIENLITNKAENLDELLIKNILKSLNYVDVSLDFIDKRLRTLAISTVYDEILIRQKMNKEIEEQENEDHKD